ncbi:hypothetical protein HCU64_00085 [Methylobacterium sp. C25]|uniref:hypothetical protein n=1 Tax=Methylobacterium sp. C25 TaxID=2721622 RepID=UPI001F1F4F1C|nr:hypothetical protein [Methylobacterium sp. C25]MCE4222137.1 hypothetical protein [Methylobacterium sp. C25]
MAFSADFRTNSLAVGCFESVGFEAMLKLHYQGDRYSTTLTWFRDTPTPFGDVLASIELTDDGLLSPGIQPAPTLTIPVIIKGEPGHIPWLVIDEIDRLIEEYVAGREAA